MLQVITGKAGAGKTGMLMEAMARDVANETRSFLIVPEQYSHQAERELCARCGSRAAMYAQVLTFTGLARWTDRELGSGEPTPLDKGGQLLCMALAVDMVYAQLRMYGSARKRAGLQSQLLEAVTELKTACITPEELLRAAGDCDGVLADKLYDLALLLTAYDTVISAGRADPTDRLTSLAQRIPEAPVGDISIYVDGFTDFTRQQLLVLSGLLEAGCDITVCLTCDPTDRDNEVYAIPRSTLRTLSRLAHDRGVELKTIHKTPTHDPTPLEFFSDHVFTYTRERMEDPQGTIRLFSADSIADECEFAAAAAIELVRDTGCRWRDIAVAVRGFDAYETLLTSSFRKYGVPLYLTKKTPLTSKALCRMIASAYEIVTGGWDAEDVFTYLRTGMTGMEQEDIDILENYVLLWDLRGSAWTREADWRLHPEGYEEHYTDADNALLRQVNALRRTVAEPLRRFAEATDEAVTGHDQIMALVGLLEDLEADRILAQKADVLEQAGCAQQAAESQKIWELTISALEQFDSILGAVDMDRERFAQLLLLMLSQYDVGTIPISVDRVSAGEMDRVRRRGLQHLIVLGASDGSLPRPEEGGGVLSTDDRARLLEVGLELDTCGEAELWREFGLIYQCLSLPRQTLTMTYPTVGDQRPSMVMSRASALFGHPIAYMDPHACKLAAYDSALELAAFSLRDGAGGSAGAAAAYFRDTDPDTLSLLHRAAEQSRGRLSGQGVTDLYGRTLRLSASRIDRFNACPFSYFMEYGLKAKPRQAASFAPPEMGTFMHYVLEHVAREVTELGGFPVATDAQIRELTDKYIAQYISQFLNDFRERSPRFIYLFRRLTRDVRAVVSDMAAELRLSKFTPLDFELDFGDPENIPPMEIGQGDASLTLTGIADRVDGWVHEGKLYLRVVDYKTGKKEFDLSDIWYGMNLQMLLYLFTLEQFGRERYGMEVVPAGVLYVPAFHKHIVGKDKLTAEEIAAQQQKKHLRSGLLLDDPAVLAAMEAGEDHRFIPVSVKKRGSSVPDALASAQQLGILARHIDRTLQKLAGELKGGSIDAAPYYKTKQKNACLYCQYKEVCNFEHGKAGESHRFQPHLSTQQVWAQMEQEGGEQDG